MNTLWQKIWADLWQSKSRTLLAINSIAAGVFCVGTLFGMIDLQLAKMDLAHQLSQPSHISLILRQDLDLSFLKQIRALEGVAELDTISPISVSFKTANSNDWQSATLMLRLPPDQQQFDKTTVQTGQWPAAANQIAIENLSAQFSGIKLGDVIEISSDKASRLLSVTGVVRHPFIKPPRFGGQVHFFADANYASAFGVPIQSVRQLLVQIKPPYSADQARIVAEQIRSLLAKQGIDVNASLLQEPEKHWGRPFLAGINLVLEWMAVVSLALACVLILNTVSAHITQQTDQIGVMKALGAARATIAKLFLLEVLVMASLAILLAVPPSLLAAHLSSCQILALFNIDCGGFDYSPKALLWMIAGGISVPLLAAFWPILQGARMTVRAAIASYGLGGDFGSSRFDWYLERLITAWLPTLYAAALGNLFRRKSRLVLTQAVLVMAGVMFLVLMSLIASLNLTLDKEMARSRYALRLGFIPDQAQQRIVDLAQTIPATSQVEIWQRMPITLLKNGLVLKQQGSLGVQLLGLPISGRLYQPFIEAGRWLDSSDAGQRHLVLSADTAQLNQLKLGDSLELRIAGQIQSWQVIGLYRWLAGSNYAVEPVYGPLDSLRQILPRGELASFALLDAAIEDKTAEAEYLKQAQQVFQQQGIKLDVYTTLAKFAQRQFARNQFQSVIGTLSGLAAMVVAVAGIGLSGTLAISVLQRRREIGVLRAIGASGGVIFRLFLLEGLFHAVLAWLISLPIAYGLGEVLAIRLGKLMFGIQLDYRFDWLAVLYWLLIALLLAAMAAFWPSRKAANLTVRESLA